MIKEQQWTPYGKKAKFVEVNIKDQNNQTIDFFKLKKENTRDVQRMVKKIKDKYNFNLSDEAKQEPEEKNRIRWLDKETL